MHTLLTSYLDFVSLHTYMGKQKTYDTALKQERAVLVGVITPGEKQYALDEKTTVSGLQFFLKNILSEL